MKSRPIGIYDSGIGGLTVLMALMNLLPNEDFIYFADTSNLPYGNKTAQQIHSFSNNIIDWMQNQMKVKMVVSGCNTSSATVLSDIIQKFDIPIIGTILPLAEHMAAQSHYQRVGIIATPVSAISKAHANAITKTGFKGMINTIACRDLAWLIEHNIDDYDALKNHLEDCLAIFHQEQLDTLVYGCTHYPLIKHIIEDLLPKETKYIDPAEHIAFAAKEMMASQNIGNIQGGKLSFYTSGDPEDFAKKLLLLTGIKSMVKKITLGDFC
jgi:glutamate racemase